jgi:hypothetical protein
VSDSVATACSSLLCIDGCSIGLKTPLQSADAALAVRLACFWLYKRARRRAPKGTTSLKMN